MNIHWAANPRAMTARDLGKVETKRQPVESACWTITPALAEADRTLFEARQSIDDSVPVYMSPCMVEPDLFKTSSKEEGNAERGRPSNVIKEAQLGKPYAVRVRKAVELCGSCKVLDTCRAMLSVVDVDSQFPEVTGVLAGYLIDPSPMGDRTREALRMTTTGGQQ